MPTEPIVTLSNHFLNSELSNPCLNLEQSSEDVTEQPISAPPQTGEDYVEGVNDYHVKYDNCYGILDDNLIKAIDFYGEDEDSESPVMRYSILSNSIWKNRSGDIDTINNTDWTIPRLGALNIDDSVFFVKRKHKQSSPTRYRKAFRLDTMKSFNPLKKELHLLNRPPYSATDGNNDNVLNSIFFPKPLGVEEALDSVLSLNRLGASFSDDYYFTLSNSVNNILLWRGCNIIGIWNKDVSGFKVSTSLFNNDLDGFGIKWEAA